MRLLICLLFALGLTHARNLASEHGSIQKLSRTIELANGLSRIQTTLQLNAQESLKLAVPSQIHSNLSSLTATSKATKQKVDISKGFHDLKM